MQSIDLIESFCRGLMAAAHQDHEFANRFGAVLNSIIAQEKVGGGDTLLAENDIDSVRKLEATKVRVRRPRRPKGIIDPLELFKEGESRLRSALAGLDLEQLKDIVAEHGMDTDKLAMKWRSRARLEDLIVLTVRDRLEKGAVFRSWTARPSRER